MKPVCLVTGAGGRLGNELCSELSFEYDIIACYRRTEPTIASQNRWPVDGQSAIKALDQRGKSVYCVQAELTNRDDVRRLVEVALARFDYIDAIVNLAADTKFHGKLLELWYDDYALKQLDTNCVSPFQLISAVHQHCWKDQPDQNAARNRSVVNISSMSGFYVFGDSRQAFYGASKAALNMLTMYLSLELAPYSVRVNALCPGRISNQLSTNRFAQVVKNLLSGDMTGAVIPLR